MEIVKSVLKHPRFIRFMIAAVVVLTVGILAAYYLGLDWGRVKETLTACWEFIEKNPWALFLAIVILPALPFPMSILLGAVGVAWNGMPLWQACLLAILGVSLNMTWTYFVAAYPARKLIDKWLTLTKFKIPELGRKDYIGLIFLLRATPGIPLFIHNYVLGFLRVPFFVYLPLSIIISSFYVVGIIMTSSSVATAAAGDGGSGVWLKIASGIGLLVIAGFVTKMIRKNYGKKAEANREPILEKAGSDTEPAIPVSSLADSEVIDSATNAKQQHDHPIQVDAEVIAESPDLASPKPDDAPSDPADK